MRSLPGLLLAIGLTAGWTTGCLKAPWKRTDSSPSSSTAPAPPTALSPTAQAAPATGVVQAAAEFGAGPRVGQLAPEIAGDDVDGVPFRLSDYRGRVVVLDFWGHW